MKYINHNSSNVVTKAPVEIRATRLKDMQARLAEVRALVKSVVGPSLYKVYDHKNNLIEHRQSTGWYDVK